MEEFGEDKQDSPSTEREPYVKTTINHRVISTVSADSRSLSYHSSEDVSLLSSDEVLTPPLVRWDLCILNTTIVTGPYYYVCACILFHCRSGSISISYCI